MLQAQSVQLHDCPGYIAAVDRQDLAINPNKFLMQAEKEENKAKKQAFYVQDGRQTPTEQFDSLASPLRCLYTSSQVPDISLSPMMGTLPYCKQTQYRGKTLGFGPWFLRQVVNTPWAPSVLENTISHGQHFTDNFLTPPEEHMRSLATAGEQVDRNQLSGFFFRENGQGKLLWSTATVAPASHKGNIWMEPGEQTREQKREAGSAARLGLGKNREFVSVKDLTSSLAAISSRFSTRTTA
ncbi:hypothetical protein DUI87_04420 [Hirundo rustica rustica]|uniref:Uncharacterized protein n=1 Tax=Hirundo rustica rustica TaxID=333673 RepID=A0A3M0KZ09_HIRRU|nr:hypothetical protein DUI87_04420 [Hirundo rustica rustica]